MSLESYESAVDAQMTDAKEMEIETCTYKDCGYLFVDIQCHYWHFHPQFIKPNTNQANLTNKKVTEKKLPDILSASNIGSCGYKVWCPRILDEKNQ